jgi:hypothetical protein
MSTPDTIQEAIEQRAAEKLDRDIEALRIDFRDMLQHLAMYIKSEINKLLNKIDA